MSGTDAEPTAAALRRLGLPDEPACRALITLLDQTISRLDHQGRILGVWLGERTYVSDVAEERLDLFETDPDHFVTDLVDKTTQVELLDAIDQALRERKRVDVTFQTRATGRLLHLAGSCAPCGDGEVIWITRDLTPQFDAQRAAEARAELEFTVSDCLQSLVGIDGGALQAGMETVMHRIAEYFGAQSAYLRRFRDPHHVEVVAQWRAPDVRRPSRGRSLAGGGVFPWASRQLAQHPILVVPDLMELGEDAATDFAYRMTNTGGRALVWVRIGPPRRPTGLLGLVFADPLDGHDAETFEPLLGLAHTMLSLAKTNVDTTRRELQHRIFELIAHGSDLADVLTQVCRLRESGWPGQHCVVWLPDEVDGFRAVGMGPEVLAAADASALAFGDLERDAIRSSQRIWVGDPTEQPVRRSMIGTLLGAGAVEMTPLAITARGDATGLLAVYDTSADPIDTEEAEPGFAALAASLASVAIERDRDLSDLAHQATHDPLTGLSNRSTFLSRLERSLEHRRSHGQLTAVLYCDVDRFKEMNDRLGHATGDRLLWSVGERIRTRVGAGGEVARLGGDEFAILLEHLRDEDEAVSVAEEILGIVRELSVPGIRSVTISIGVAVSGSGADHADGLLRDADMAMYQAKSGGRDRVEVFRERIRRAAQDRDRLGRDLAEAIANGQIEVHYQPMITLATGELTGFEALARWNHPARGPITPNEFVPIAESNGLIEPLGDLVLERALGVAARWSDLDMHVNLSPHQVDTAGSVDRLLHAVAASGVAPNRIAMEITENVLLAESPTTSVNLQIIMDAGIGLVLDDFGTGYASLTYLRRIPFRGIKVDKSFVSGMETNPGDASIVSMVLALAASLELDVVAEGVETAAQEHALREMGCSRVQGFRYSPAVPDAEISDLIRRFD